MDARPSYVLSRWSGDFERFGAAEAGIISWRFVHVPHSLHFVNAPNRDSKRDPDFLEMTRPKGP